MRELVLGAVLKRFFERDHQKCLQSQHANDRNGSVTENYPQCCGGGGDAGNVKQEAKQGFLSQISPSCGTRQSTEASTMIRLSQQQKEQEKEKSKDDEEKKMNSTSNSSFKPKNDNHIFLDDEPWSCDLCGRTAKGTYCSWCCGEDYENSNKNASNSDRQEKTKNTSSSMMMMMMPSGNYQSGRTNNDDNDDSDCSFDAVIDHSDDVIMSNSPIRLSNSPLNEANRNQDGSKHKINNSEEINSKAIVAAQQERRRRTRETAEVIELD